MDSFFFRVDHDLLRSESFKSLGGSAIKVYLVIGLYADFDTGWAYPSVRTLARQSGLSRQTVLTAIEDLLQAGVLAVQRMPGKSNAYRILREAPQRPRGKPAREVEKPRRGSPKSLQEGPLTGLDSLQVAGLAGPESGPLAAYGFGLSGQQAGPKREPDSREDSASIPIPGTPFRLSAEGRLLVAVDLQELLTSQGIPRQLALKLAEQKGPEAVAKVLLNALYLQSQGKLQNGPGYIRAGIEDGYDLLPQVANRLEARRRELQERLKTLATKRQRSREEESRASEEEAVSLMLEQLGEDELQDLVERAVETLPTPLVRRNPTLSNPFVRAKVYELAGGEPLD
ncbi:MAG TPA: helix-turn-helix domain-containing protein [Isosphaeraceae bacterium]|nr:helix-turn-helix domain-containing protein [Isosphaeraceae bacterium]